jgi:DNA modification methylase
MTLAFNRVIIGDCRETLCALPDETFQCCVTSPPER